MEESRAQYISASNIFNGLEISQGDILDKIKVRSRKGSGMHLSLVALRKMPYSGLAESTNHSTRTEHVRPFDLRIDNIYPLVGQVSRYWASHHLNCPRCAHSIGVGFSQSSTVFSIGRSNFGNPTH